MFREHSTFWRSSAAVLILTAVAALAMQAARAGSLAAIAPLGVTPGQTIEITGTGFDEIAANNTVTFTPSQSPAVSAPATTIAALDAVAGLRRLTVRVPDAMPVGAAAVRVTTRNGDVVEARALDVLSLQLSDVRSAAPGATGVVVRMVGSTNARFVDGATRAAFGRGITVRAIAIDSATVLRATIDIASNAPAGPRDVVVVSPMQRAALAGGFSIVALPTNTAPVVSAGAATTVTLPAAASLAGTVTDDGLPAGAPVTSTWTQASGPGVVTFANAANAATTATFDRSGTYVLRLSATDSQLTATSDVTVTVEQGDATIHVNGFAGVYDGNAHGATGTATGSHGEDLTSLLHLGTTFVNPPGGVAHWTFDGTAIYKPASGDVPITISAATPTNHPPVARAGGPYSGTAGIAVSFDGSQSSDPDDDAVTYAWSFGDGTTGTGVTPTHTYTIADRFTVTLTVTDPSGTAASTTATADIAQANRPPTANAGGPYRGDAGAPVAFSGTAADPDHDALTFAWDFGDGASGAGTAPIHAFASAGTFAITLTVTDSSGASAVAKTSAIVGAPVDRSPPAVKVSAPKTALPGAHVTVTASAADNVGVASVTFDVDGSATQLLAPPYERAIDIPVVAAPGTTTTVTATARDAANNAGTDQAVITVVAAPDTTPPAVAIQLPAQASPGTTVLLSAEASDDVGVRAVTFATGGRVFATSGSTPYRASFTVPADAAPGSSLAFVARASDFANNASESAGSLLVVAAPDTTPPTVTLTSPSSVVEGGLLHLTATAHDDVHVASVDFLVDDVVVGTAVTAPYVAGARVARPAGSVLQVRALAKDASNNEATSDAATRVVAVGSVAPGAVTGRVYDDTTGLPVSGASIALVGTDAEGTPYAASATSDNRGQYVLQASAGDGVLQITRAGSTRVDRPVIVPESLGADVFDARLTPLAAPVQTITAVIGATVRSGDATLTIAPGALERDADLQVTRVGAQGIEGPLPAGWSPIAAVDITPHGIVLTTAEIAVATPVPFASATPLTLATWDEGASAWRAVATTSATADASTLAAAITSSGQYAWLAADRTPTLPPAAVAGDLLSGVARADVPDPAMVEITPKPNVVFYQPGVNSIVTGVVKAALSSGTHVRAQLTESYQFKSAAPEGPDPFLEDFVFYQTPGSAASVSAAFTVTPSLTFDPVDLQQGTITVELRAPDAVTTSALLGADGGTVTAPSGESLDVPASALATPTPMRVERTAADALGLPLPQGLLFVGAATVRLSGVSLNAPAVVSVPRPANVDDASPIVVLRLADVGGSTRWLLAGVGRAIGTRVVMDRALAGTATMLDGVTREGRYVFARGANGLGFATGTVFGATGAALPGALVTTGEFPVAGLSTATGRYVVATAVGAVTLTARDLQRLDSTTAATTMPASGAVVSLDLHANALNFTVTSLTPSDGAASVPLATSIAATFSAPIDPATVTGAAATNVQLKAADGSIVPGSVALSAGNTKATFRPSLLLAANGTYTVTLSAGITDIAGHALGSPVVAHFTSLDTTPPPTPTAGSLSATIPDNGFTTVSGAQGTAGVHDTVAIVNTTRKTSCAALVNADGSFSTTCAASLGDALTLTIKGGNGSETAVPLPAFTRTNADGSVSTVVGGAGGFVSGPAGIGVDVPAFALPDGTVVTVGSVDEAAFPIKLTDEQKPFFSFTAGITLDFGGATPAQYVNVSIPTRGGEPDDEQRHWIVGQVVAVGAKQLLNAVDTARIIDGRISTSSKPCQGVQAAGMFGIIGVGAQQLGVLYGSFVQSSSGAMQAVSLSQQTGIGGGPSSITSPLSVLATAADVNYAEVDPVTGAFTKGGGASGLVCMPTLSGDITVQPNVQRIAIPADQLAPADREIVVTDKTRNRDFHYPRSIVDYRFLVDGSVKNTFTVTVNSSLGFSVPTKAFQKLPAQSPGFVNISLDTSKLTFNVASVKVVNVTTGAVRDFNMNGSAAGPPVTTNIPVDGAAADDYDVKVYDAAGVYHTVQFAVKSPPAGAGNLVVRAQPSTVPPNTDVSIDRMNATLDPVTHACVCTVIETIPIPASQIVGGGFEFSFVGNPATETFRVTERFDDGRPPLQIGIPRVALTISLPETGQVISTIDVPVPPPDEPFPLGKIDGDVTPPRITAKPILSGFDPTDNLTFTFSEGVTRTSAINGITLADDQGHRISGTLRFSNQNRSITFVPDAPLHPTGKAHPYTLTMSGIRDAAGNAMKSATFSITTSGPLAVDVAPNQLGLVEQLMLVHQSTPAVKTYGYAITADDATPHFALTNRDSFVVVDLTIPTQPVILSSVPAGDGGRLTVVRGVDLPTHGENPCTGGTGFHGDLGIVSSFTTGLGSSVTFYDLSTNRSDPCQLGAKLLTLNPAGAGVISGSGSGTAVVRADGVIPAADGIARTVVTLRDGSKLKSYTAIENVGLMMVDVGDYIPARPSTCPPPSVLPGCVTRQLEPMADGNYVDVATAGNLLLAIEKSVNRLDVFDASLGYVSGIQLPSVKTPLGLVYAADVPFDLNHDGQIGQDEVRDLAFVGGTGGIDIIDVTDPTSPDPVGRVPLPLNVIYQLEFLASTRQLVAGGMHYVNPAASVPVGEYERVTIDLSGPYPFAPIDKDGDGQDDRISFRSAPGQYATGSTPHRAITVDADEGVLYIGKGNGYDVDQLDVNLAGAVTYTFFPLKPPDPAANDPGGIDYANGTRKPVRGAIVELRNAKGVAIDTTHTDETGFYYFHAPVGATLEVVVKAALGEPGSESAVVDDNTNGFEVYAKSTGTFVLDTKQKAKSIVAETIWNPAATDPVTGKKGHYTKREAAAFAILDAVYQAQETIRQVDPGRTFHKVHMSWSVKNVPSADSNPSIGHIGPNRFESACATYQRVRSPLGNLCPGGSEGGVYLAGAENIDTDEYDSAVVLHHWTHYFQAAYGRDDGATAFGESADVSFVDPRVAFSEGFATAFAAMLLNEARHTGTGLDPWYIDTAGPGQVASPSSVNLEKDSFKFGGFFRTSSVAELLWDLYDGWDTGEDDQETGAPVPDSVELGFAPIYDALMNGVVNTPAFTTIHALLAYLEQQNSLNPTFKSSVAIGIEQAAAAENIDAAHANDYEQLEIRDVGTLPPPFGLIQVGPLYTTVPADGTLKSGFDKSTPWAGSTLQTDTVFNAAGSPGNNWRDNVFLIFGPHESRLYNLVVTPLNIGTVDENVRLTIHINRKGQLAELTAPAAGSPIDEVVPLDASVAYTAAVSAQRFDGANWVPAAGAFEIRLIPK